MVLAKLLEPVLAWLAEQLGANGLAIGLIATATVALYYLREVSGVFVVIARYARTLSYVGFALLAVLVVGTATGAINLSADGSVIGQLLEQVLGAIL